MQPSVDGAPDVRLSLPNKETTKGTDWDYMDGDDDDVDDNGDVDDDDDVDNDGQTRALAWDGEDVIGRSWQLLINGRGLPREREDSWTICWKLKIHGTPLDIWV